LDQYGDRPFSGFTARQQGKVALAPAVAGTETGDRLAGSRHAHRGFMERTLEAVGRQHEPDGDDAAHGPEVVDMPPDRPRWAKVAQNALPNTAQSAPGVDIGSFVDLPGAQGADREPSGRNPEDELVGAGNTVRYLVAQSFQAPYGAGLGHLGASRSSRKRGVWDPCTTHRS